MAFTESQYITIFEVLEIPHTTVTTGQIYALTDKGDAYMSGNSWDAICLAKAVSGVYIWVSGMSASGQAVLSGMLTSYEAYGNDTTSLVGGSLGDINGIDWSVDRDRDRLAKRIRGIVPFWRKHDDLIRNRPSATVFAS